MVAGMAKLVLIGSDDLSAGFRLVQVVAAQLISNLLKLVVSKLLLQIIAKHFSWQIAKLCVEMC